MSGPGPAAIAAMGNKVEARRLAIELGVPVIPGSPEPVDAEDAARVAEAVGYPVMLKASAGGGGRGMRLARDAAELGDILGSASAEAKAAFGDGAIYIERYVGRARHVEVQVVFDAHGNGITLGERDCTSSAATRSSSRRRRSALPEAAREGMFEAALRLCRHVDYRGVGTVEFLYDQVRREAYFIEMNTRLQVEHPVTEDVTGLDLVGANSCGSPPASLCGCARTTSPPRPRDRVPDQRRGSGGRLPAVRRDAGTLVTATRAGRAGGYPLLHGLPGAAVLRFAPGEGDRVGRGPDRRLGPGPPGPG